MLRRFIVLSVLAFIWGGSISRAAAAHELPYEFRGTHIALSIERFMGMDYTDFEGPGRARLTARLLLNASEPVPTTFARFGFDVFIERFSVGLAGGVTSENVGLIAPRVGYLFGLTPTIGLWLRGGAFYASAGPNYMGVSAEALLEWFPYPLLAFHLGPTIDIAFADKPNPNYVSLGIPECGMTAWF
jgi:hypothetical protein